MSAPLTPPPAEEHSPPTTAPVVRCAIYARVSVEGAKQSAFSSIEAQVQACHDYIASQHHKGWIALDPSYEDHGFSGGNIDRPALAALLSDMAAGKIDVVLVQRLDRLSRSIGDLCALVPLFEGPGIRLISLTQDIDTATTSGRLSLNLLTSFAEFERLISGERRRDKVATTRARGLWQGYAVPLGYRVDMHQRLVVNPPEAEMVKDIFKHFLDLGSTKALVKYLAKRGVRTKSWETSEGNKRGGRPFDRNALYKLLNNRMYIGEMYYHDGWHSGEHTPIIDLALWQQVHNLMHQRARRTGVKSKPKEINDFFLKDRLFWEDGRAFKPNESSEQNGKRYKYYIVPRSNQEKSSATAPPNLTTKELHDVVTNYVLQGFRSPDNWLAALPEQLKQEPVFEAQHVARVLGSIAQSWGVLFQEVKTSLIRSLVEKVILHPNGMEISIDAVGLGAIIKVCTREAPD